MINKQLINFDVEFAEVLEEEDQNSQFATAKIQAFASGPNRHNLVCSEEVLKETASTIYNKPILYTIDKKLDDFYTHVDPDKSLIAGFVVPGSAEFVRLPDQRLSLQVLAKIWKRYAFKFVDIFKRDKNKKISVEMELYHAAKVDSQLTEMLSFAYTGVCVLSDFVTEASPGANIEMISFAEKNAEFYKAKELEFGKYIDIDFKVPRKIKSIVRGALELAEKNVLYKNTKALAVARHLLNNEFASPEKIRQIANRVPKDIDPDDTSSFDYVTHCLYGSFEGHRWASRLASAMDEADSKNISYFTGGDDKNPEKKEVDTVTDEVIKEFSEQEKEVEVENKVESEKVDMAEEKPEKQDEEPEDDDNNEENMSFDFSVAKPYFEGSENLESLFAEFEKPLREMNHAMVFEAFCNRMKGMGEDFSKLSAEKEEMCKRFAEMESACKEHMAELEELRKFKVEKEQEQFTFAVNTLLKEIESKVQIPAEELENLREESKKYSLETIDAFANLARAKGFTFAVKEKKEDDGITRIGLPQVPQNSKSNGNLLW